MTSTLKLLLVFLAVFGLAQCQAHEHGHATSAPPCVAGHCKLQLSPDLTMRYQIHLPDDYDSHSEDECERCKISVQLLYDGYTWLGIGVSLKGKMVGSHAVIGQPEISEPKPLYLGGKDIDSVKPTQAAHSEDAKIAFADGKTVMDFTMSFSDWGVPLDDDLMSISLKNPSTFIWAHGVNGDTELKHHGPYNKGSHTIDNLMSLSHSREQSFNSMTLQEQSRSTKSAWLAHGIIAFLAWGIFAPMSVTTAIMRDGDVPAFCKGLASMISKKWLYIHVGLNTLTYAFTIILFSVAVSNINRENDSHWEHAHSKMGLAMFLLISFQVLGGYFRPSSATLPSSDTTETEENGEEGISNEDGIEEHRPMPMKSMLRQAWELFHNMFGIMLFLFGVWQMHAGLELYHQRYASSTLVAVFYILWMALWTGIIIGGSLYKWFLRSRGLGSADGDNGKETELPGQSEPEDDDVAELQEFS